MKVPLGIEISIYTDNNSIAYRSAKQQAKHFKVQLGTEHAKINFH